MLSREIVLRRAFKKLDKDDSGFLSREEVEAATASDEVGVKVAASKVADMLIALVTDDDKQVHYSL